MATEKDCNADPFRDRFRKLEVCGKFLCEGEITAPKGINLLGGKVINAGHPTNSRDYATKEYVDSTTGGLDYKESVRISTVVNITDLTDKSIVEAALDTISSAAPVLEINERVLVKNQSDAKLNGIYVWSILGLVRSQDMDGSPTREISGGNITFVEEGDTNASTGWLVTGTGIKLIGVDDINWTKVAGTGTGGVNELNDLTDVVLSSVQNNDVFLYNGSTNKWNNFTNGASYIKLGAPSDAPFSGTIGITNSDTITNALQKLDDYVVNNSGGGGGGTTALVNLIDNSSSAVNIGSTNMQGSYMFLVKSSSDNGASAVFVGVSSTDGSPGNLSRLVNAPSATSEEVNMLWPASDNPSLYHSVLKSGGSGATIQYNVKVYSAL